MRLSEARARIDLSTEITPEHVKEAARLLGNSILKVYKPDLEIEPFRETMNEAKESDIPGLEKKKTKKTKITLKAAEYEQISRALVLHMESEERKEKEDFKGIKQKNLIEWYVGSNVSNLDSMDDYERLMKILKAVITRMIKLDRTFIVSEDCEDIALRLLKLHPNYYMDN